jgi:hypothetical protein
MDYSRKPIHVLFSALDFALMARNTEPGFDYDEFRNNTPVDYRPATPGEEAIWEELTHPCRYRELVKYPSVIEAAKKLPFSAYRQRYCVLYECALSAATERFEREVSSDESAAVSEGQAETTHGALGILPSLATTSSHRLDYSKEPIHSLILALDFALMARNAEPGFDYAEFRRNPPDDYRPATGDEVEIWEELTDPHRYEELVKYRSLFEAKTGLPFSRLDKHFAFLYDCALKSAGKRVRTGVSADEPAADEQGRAKR